MSLIRWDPFREMVSLRDAMDRLFEESFVGVPARRREEGGQPLAVDVYETDSKLKVEASLPGLKPEDVDISVVGNMHTIKAETKREEEREEGQYHYRERYYGSYQRSIPLPSDMRSQRLPAARANARSALPRVRAIRQSAGTVATNTGT